MGHVEFYRKYPENKRLLEAAKLGVDFFIKYFWDPHYGGWYWKTKRDGTVIDDGKVTYGQSFAIYALFEYSLATGDPIGLNTQRRPLICFSNIVQIRIEAAIMKT